MIQSGVVFVNILTSDITTGTGTPTTTNNTQISYLRRDDGVRAKIINLTELREISRNLKFTTMPPDIYIYRYTSGDADRCSMLMNRRPERSERAAKLMFRARAVVLYIQNEFFFFFIRPEQKIIRDLLFKIPSYV